MFYLKTVSIKFMKKQLIEKLIIISAFLNYKLMITNCRMFILNAGTRIIFYNSEPEVILGANFFERYKVIFDFKNLTMQVE